MYFQTLDSKAGCFGIYYDGKISQIQQVQQELTKTWEYSRHLDGKKIECAKIFCGGAGLEEICPEHLAKDWNHSKEKLKSFLRSLLTSKVDLNKHCFYDLVPERFLVEHNWIKTEITKHVFQNWQKPANYDFIHALCALTDKISDRELNIDEKCVQRNLAKATSRKVLKALKSGKNRAVYNVFGTKTGRLSTTPGSFPILNLDKRLRGCLTPHNDLFLELDFNSAELRVLLALSGINQPEEDIHEWNAKNVFAGKSFTRAEAKKAIFAWLYNPDAVHKTAEKVYNRSKVKGLYYKDGIVTNPFKRSFESDDFRGLNHIVQSTTSDLLLFQMLCLDKLLSDKKSFISFCMHDSVIVDLDKSEKDLIFEMIDLFKETPLGNFKTNVALGRNYGGMREIDV